MKTLMNGIKQILLVLASGLILMAGLSGCKQDHLTFNTTSTVNLYDYLKQNPDQFSLFQQIVDKAGYASFLNTYGTYTLFAPTNAGVNAYLKANGKANVDAIDAATAKGLVSIALIADTISSQNFTDGKIRTPSTSGQYLITGSLLVNGTTNTVINKQANLVTANIKLGNGLLHIVDNMLFPAGLTLAQTVEQNSKYTIFTAILKATGFYDTLNVAVSANPNPTRKYLTLIGITDSSYKAAGFADYNAVKTRYSTKGDPKNHADSLWLYAAYHIWPEVSFLSDIAINNSHTTLAPLEITTSQLLGQDLLINNDTFNGNLELGQILYRPASDISASNGVLHSAQGYAAVIGGVSYKSVGNYSIKIRFPSPVYFDLGNQPEILKTPGLYRQPNKAGTFLIGQLSLVFMEGAGGAGNNMTYQTEPNPPNTNDYYYNNDYMVMGTRWRLGSNGLHKAEFTTPVIVKGTYKIWVDYKQNGSGTITLSYFDNVALPNTFNNKDALNPTETDAQAEARGFKSYSDSPVGTSTTVGYNGFTGRLLGIVNIATTDHHKIRFETTAVDGSNPGFILDVVEFRPITMDQVHPRLGRAGVLVP
jgi:uncharacterized surface protein with fasciclin (FAS1) repeats